MKFKNLDTLTQITYCDISIFELTQHQPSFSIKALKSHSHFLLTTNFFCGIIIAQYLYCRWCVGSSPTGYFTFRAYLTVAQLVERTYTILRRLFLHIRRFESFQKTVKVMLGGLFVFLPQKN